MEQSCGVSIFLPLLLAQIFDWLDSFDHKKTQGYIYDFIAYYKFGKIVLEVKRELEADNEKKKLRDSHWKNLEEEKI